MKVEEQVKRRIIVSFMWWNEAEERERERRSVFRRVKTSIKDREKQAKERNNYNFFVALGGS